MRALAGLVLAAWLIVGLWLTLQPAHPLPSQVVDDNLVPFLLPLGLLGPIALPVLRRWWLILPLALLLSVSIELAQHWIPDRSADIDDVIVNVTGALIGYGFWRLALHRLAPP